MTQDEKKELITFLEDVIENIKVVDDAGIMMFYVGNSVEGELSHNTVKGIAEGVGCIGVVATTAAIQGDTSVLEGVEKFKNLSHTLHEDISNISRKFQRFSSLLKPKTESKEDQLAAAVNAEAELMNDKLAKLILKLTKPGEA